MFSFLYRVFYDKTLFSSFVEQGKGYGFKLLFILTCFVALCLSVRVFFFLFSLSPELISEIAARMPEVVIEKGKIISPENYRYAYVSADKSVFFVFDTSKDPVKLQGLPKNGVYITHDAVLSVNADKIKRMPFVQLLDGADVVLDQNNMRQWGNKTVSVMKLFLPPLCFVFCLPGVFSMYFLISFFYMLISYAVTFLMKKNLLWDQRMRLAVLSILPAYVLNAISFLLDFSVRIDRMSIIITLIYMYCFLKDGERKQLELRNG